MWQCDPCLLLTSFITVPPAERQQKALSLSRVAWQWRTVLREGRRKESRKQEIKAGRPEGKKGWFKPWASKRGRRGKFIQTEKEEEDKKINILFQNKANPFLLHSIVTFSYFFLSANNRPENKTLTTYLVISYECASSQSPSCFNTCFLMSEVKVVRAPTKCLEATHLQPDLTASHRALASDQVAPVLNMFWKIQIFFTDTVGVL